MSFSHAQAADIPALKQLWMTCFGDTEDYVNLYFDHSFSPEQVFVLRAEQIAAMLISLPVTHVAADGEAQQGAYLYAVCTAPELRGRGLCRALMQQTEQALAAQGCTFTCLKAGSEGLSAMYERMGYQTTFTNRELCLSVPATQFKAEPKLISPEHYYALRQFALRGDFIDYVPAVLAHQARLGALFCLDGGAAFGAFERYGDTLICKEYFGDETLLPALGAQFGAAQVIARTTGTAPFAMAKPLSSLPCPKGYLAFAFD